MKKYKSIIFDCDGVILNSNKIKTASFKKILIQFNRNAVNEFLNYHKNNGGVSRYIKIDYFLTSILPKYSNSVENKDDTLSLLLEKYSHECKNSLYSSEVVYGLDKLKEITCNIPWTIVSGGDQKELRDVFEYKNLIKYFDGGIYGSPEKKIDIIKREINRGLINYPALFIGDSKLDHTVAKSLNLDFLFVTNWTEFKGYQDYCSCNAINTISSVSELINIFKE